MDNQDGGSGDASSELEAYKQAIEEWKDAYEKAQKVNYIYSLFAKKCSEL